MFTSVFFGPSVFLGKGARVRKLRMPVSHLQLEGFLAVPICTTRCRRKSRGCQNPVAFFFFFLTVYYAYTMIMGKPHPVITKPWVSASLVAVLSLAQSPNSTTVSVAA